MKWPDFRLAPIVSAGFRRKHLRGPARGANDCLVVDPGLEPGKIIDYLEQHQLTPAAILITHGHADHIAGNAPETTLARLPVGHRRGDAAKLTDPVLNLSAALGQPMVSPPADLTVRDGEVFSAAGFDLEIREIPGHSIGSVVYLWREHQPMIALWAT